MLAEAAACATKAQQLIDLSDWPKRSEKVFNIGALLLTLLLVPRQTCQQGCVLQAALLRFQSDAELKELELAPQAEVLEALR